MQHATPAESPINQAIQMTAAQAVTRRPALANLVKPFADLFLHKARCIARLDAHARAVDLPDARNRLVSGIPLLTALPLSPWREPIDMAFIGMLPAIAQAFPAMRGSVAEMSAAYQAGGLNLVALAEEYLNGGFKGYDDAARLTGITRDALGFFMNIVLSAALGSIGPRIWAEAGDADWTKGFCPICGSLPSMSYLTRPKGEASEFLKDSGGQKYLHCGLCGHDWRIGRHICPVCDNEDKDLRMYLMIPEEPGERVDVCRKCGLYLPCLDLREREPLPHLDTAAVCMAHLDILARKEGYKPLADLPWNRFDG